MSKVINNVDIEKSEKKFYSKKRLEILQKEQIKDILKGHDDVKKGRVMTEEEFWSSMNK